MRRFWSTGGTVHGQEPFLTWIQDVANTTNAPFVFSVSYGDVESSLDVGYMERINQEFQIVGARGGVGAIVQCGLTRRRHLDHVRVGRLWRRLRGQDGVSARVLRADRVASLICRTVFQPARRM